jgi:hypothetical protein
MAPKNSKYIKDIYCEFDKAFNMEFINYKNNILLKTNLNFQNTFWHDDDTYLMQHAIINYLMYNNKVYNLNLKDAVESMFKIHFNEGFNNEKNIIKKILELKDDNLYAIKLTSKNRIAINNYLEQYIDKINSI